MTDQAAHVKDGNNMYDHLLISAWPNNTIAQAIIVQEKDKKMIGKKIAILSHQSLYQSLNWKERRLFFAIRKSHYCNNNI